MNTTNSNENSRGGRDIYTYLSTRWLFEVVEALTVGISNFLTVVISVVVTLLSVIGGLWLAYRYLPGKTFNLIALVVAADVLLGLVLRSVFRWNNQRKETP